MGYYAGPFYTGVAESVHGVEHRHRRWPVALPAGDGWASAAWKHPATPVAVRDHPNVDAPHSGRSSLYTSEDYKRRPCVPMRCRFGRRAAGLRTRKQYPKPIYYLLFPPLCAGSPPAFIGLVGPCLSGRGGALGGLVSFLLAVAPVAAAARARRTPRRRRGPGDGGLYDFGAPGAKDARILFWPLDPLPT